MRTSGGSVGDPKGRGFFLEELLPKNSRGDQNGMCSPEPRISSHSTTGARGGSAALIGPSAAAAAGGSAELRLEEKEEEEQEEDQGDQGSERRCLLVRPGSGRRTQRGELVSGSLGSYSGAGTRCAKSRRRGAHLGFIGRAGLGIAWA